MGISEDHHRANPGPYISSLDHIPVPLGGIPTKVRGDWTDRPANTGAGFDDPRLSDTDPATDPASTGSTGGSAWDTDERLAEVAAPLHVGSSIRDRFVLVEELGRGGMGVVYKAYDRSRDDSSERHVAIKVLNDEFKRHPLAVRALQREARKAQKLAHPNVVTVHDFDRYCGNVYMVMELLSGRSLDEVILADGTGGIPLGPAMEIIKSLGAGLSYAHAQGIIHCDFKPSNAFLCSDGKVKVLDFGIARAAPSLLQNAEKTKFDAGQLHAVSPAYASLEMLEQAGEPDVRDDVYAFSCVAYEVLTGSHPYQRIDAAKAFQSGLQPRPIRKLTRKQWRVLRQGLEFRRADRCASIDSLVSDLTAPPGRTKLWAATLAACLVALTIAAVFVLQRPVTQHRAAGSNSSSRGDVSAQQNRQVPVPQPTAKPANTRPIAPPAQRVATETPTTSTPRAAQPQVTQRQATQPQATPVQTARAQATQPQAPQPQATRPQVTRSPVQQDALPAAARDTAATQDRLPTAQGETRAPVGIEGLKKNFEELAAAGDVEAATKTANALRRASAESTYVTQTVPEILSGAYLHRAKTQFASGQVDAALQTLKDGRLKFGRSLDLRDLEVRYVGAATLYDRLRSAVTLNVTEMQSGLETLRAAEGGEYDIAAQMLAQTLADRVADQRAANRSAVADRLLEAGKQIFPSYASLLERGRPGVLPDAPVQVDEN